MIEKDIFIFETNTVKEALKKLDKTAEKTLLVVNEQKKILGAITDGDIRSYLLQGNSMDNNIKKVYNPQITLLESINFTLELAKHLLITKKIELLPIVDENKIVIDYITWERPSRRRKK